MAPKIIRQSKWLQDLPEQPKEEMFERIKFKQTPAGKTLFRQGDPAAPGGPALVALVEGQARIELIMPDAWAQNVHLLNPGDWYGAVNALEHRARWADLLALHDCTFAYLTRSDFGYLTERHPILWRGLAIIMRDNLMLALERVEILMLRDAHLRVVRLLAHFAAQMTLPAALRLSQEEIAGVVNVSVRTVRNSLKELEKNGHIRAEYGRIFILNDHFTTRKDR